MREIEHSSEQEQAQDALEAAARFVQERGATILLITQRHPYIVALARHVAEEAGVGVAVEINARTVDVRFQPLLS